MVGSWEGKEFVVGSSVFKVTPPAGNRSRRLVAVDESKPEEEKNVNLEKTK
jgi:hypothetical protein